MLYSIHTLQMMHAMLIGIKIGRVPPPATNWGSYDMGDPFVWPEDKRRAVELFFARMPPPVWEPVTRVLVGEVVSLISCNYTHSTLQ